MNSPRKGASDRGQGCACDMKRMSSRLLDAGKCFSNSNLDLDSSFDIGVLLGGSKARDSRRRDKQENLRLQWDINLGCSL
jgi:hypothetical protein